MNQMKISLRSIYNWYRSTIRNPKYRWWIIGGTLIYLLSPFDISPDFLPFIGELDDLAIVTLMISEVSQLLVDNYKSRKIQTPSDSEEVKDKTVEVNAVSVK
jgi:uncharacterized membrane protein YkvA (DUF1232 family)